MATIELDVDNEWRVVAKSLDANNQNDKRGGNLDLPGGSQVVWKASSSPGWVEKYKVTFRDSANPATKVWPFAGTEPAGRILLLNRGQSSDPLTTLGNGQQIIKYDVEVETNASPGNPGKKPEALDPMIVIRPASITADSVTLGVTCAVLGALAGAAVTWALS